MSRSAPGGRWAKEAVSLSGSSHIICEFCRRQVFIEIMLILQEILQNMAAAFCLGHFRKSISRVVVTGFLPFSDLLMISSRTLGLDARH